MKARLLCVAVASLLCFGCMSSSDTKAQNTQYWYVDIDDCKFEIVTIENCEYIKNQVHGFRHVLTHKGNCKNPIHKGK
jgi:uncharacterized protein YcfL